jgi:hypothetical protein
MNPYGRHPRSTGIFLSLCALSIALVVGLVLGAVAVPLAGEDDIAGKMSARRVRLAESDSITIMLEPMPPKYQISGGSTLDLFSASADSVFWCGPRVPNPHSWLSRSIICRTVCDFDIVICTANGAVIDTVQFRSVESATYRIRVSESNRPVPGIYGFRFIYRGEVVDDFRIDIQDPR